MSKYDKLWAYIENCGRTELVLSFDKAAAIAGVPIVSITREWSMRPGKVVQTNGENGPE